jgi:uncharacterized protein GlcG (DUF336 family)
MRFKRHGAHAGCSALAATALAALLQSGAPGMAAEKPQLQMMTMGGAVVTASKDQAKDVQRALKEKGYYSGAVDGEWGPDSQAALQKFQDDQKLSENGKLTPKTAQALDLGANDQSARLNPAPAAVASASPAPAVRPAAMTQPADAAPAETPEGDQPAQQAPAQSADAAAGGQCPVSRDELVQALKENVKASGGKDNGGLPVNEWAAVVDRTGHLCAIAFSGDQPTDQWLGSRAIAIEKANTVVFFSLDKYAISTANLWAQSQPGASLYGVNASNPPLAQKLYQGPASQWGTDSDPLLGQVVGGVIAFGGGLALYRDNKLVGGLGASGNTACADHNIAWRVRSAIGMGKVPNGPSPDHNDEIIYDVGANGKSASGWGHPTCGMSAYQVAQQIKAGVVNMPEQTGSINAPLPESTPLDTAPPKNAAQ